jgi:hexokinase
MTVPNSKELVDQDSWRQRSELEAMADLPPELEKELAQLDKDFWVSRQKLKDISKRFREELEEGIANPKSKSSSN